MKHKYIFVTMLVILAIFLQSCNIDGDANKKEGGDPNANAACGIGSGRATGTPPNAMLGTLSTGRDVREDKDTYIIIAKNPQASKNIVSDTAATFLRGPGDSINTRFIFEVNFGNSKAEILNIKLQCYSVKSFEDNVYLVYGDLNLKTNKSVSIIAQYFNLQNEKVYGFIIKMKSKGHDLYFPNFSGGLYRDISDAANPYEVIFPTTKDGFDKLTQKDINIFISNKRFEKGPFNSEIGSIGSSGSRESLYLPANIDLPIITYTKQ